MNHRMRSRYIWIPLLLVVVLIPLGFIYVSWTQSGTGAGLYSHDWSPDPVQGYWDPASFYTAPGSVQGVFGASQCIECHQAVTPSIVNDWRDSRHAQVLEPVACPACHGSDHQTLYMPTPEMCGGCHNRQHSEFLDEARYGFPSHVLAMDRAINAPHFVDKPKAEVQSCVQCHSVATKCDSCHSRHRFDAAEARRPEACITCHSGPPHPDDESYFSSAHGKIYLEEGDEWDWSKPLRKGNYKVPTCAYCHMEDGRHQVADKSMWKFGIKEINPNTSGNKILRERWVQRCADCHEPEQARQWLGELDQERKQAWQKLYTAEEILRELRADEAFYPAAGERPPYPSSLWDAYFPRERIGFFEGQAAAFYNVSPIERDYFEMWYFDNLSAYKGAAHGDSARVSRGHMRMQQRLMLISQRADALQAAKRSQKGKLDLSDLWNEGKYTNLNAEQN